MLTLWFVLGSMSLLNGERDKVSWKKYYLIILINLFFGHTCGIWKLWRQWLDLTQSWDLHHRCSNARSWTSWAGDGTGTSTETSRIINPCAAAGTPCRVLFDLYAENLSVMKVLRKSDIFNIAGDFPRESQPNVLQICYSPSRATRTFLLINSEFSQ